MPGHLWLRDEPSRQTAVWHAISSVLHLCDKDGLNEMQTFPQGTVRVIVRSSSYGLSHMEHAVGLIQLWFKNGQVLVEGVLDNTSEWNFEISVNGVLLHSRSTQGHGFFHDDWSQKCLVWRAVTDLLKSGQLHAWSGA